VPATPTRQKTHADFDVQTKRHLQVLEAIAADDRITQRTLAGHLGIALGLSNLLLRRIINKGWVKVVNIKANRVHYLLTPEGVAEKARVTRMYVENTIHLYTETRERIRCSLARLSTTWPNGDGSSVTKRVVFYGCGEVAEIAFICLDGTDLRLVGVVDDTRRKPFFGMFVHPPTALSESTLAGEPFDRLIVMSFRKADDIGARLKVLRFPEDRVYWLD
jgi:DNA-binding MarR family transcriptional regulator